MAFESSRIVEARRTLVNFTVSDFPESKKGWREKIHKSVHKIAYPKIHDSSAPGASTEEFAKLIAGAGANG